MAGERPTADLFGERVLRATAGGTVRFDSTDEMLLADGSQDALVGYLERCPFVVLGDGERRGCPTDGPRSRRATDSSRTGATPAVRSSGRPPPAPGS